jgi:hypothetical protein
MKMNRFRMLLLATVLTGAALLSAAGPAISEQCIPWMCWIADPNTVCCWDEYCNLWCG